MKEKAPATLDDLNDIVDKDLKLDINQLGLESVRTFDIQTKYLRYYAALRKVIAKVEGIYNQIYLDRWEYYLGKSDPQIYKDNPQPTLVMKPDVGKYLDADEDLSEIAGRLHEKRVMLEVVEKVLKILDGRSFAISNALKDFERKKGVID